MSEKFAYSLRAADVETEFDLDGQDPVQAHFTGRLESVGGCPGGSGQ